MTKKLFNLSTISIVVVSIFLLAFVAFAGTVFAQNVSNIEFPIADLGNCASADECKAYCDDSANIDSCIAWAKSNGIESERPEAPVPEEGGPGGCASKEECRAYCDGGEHTDECLNFAVEHGHMTADEAEKIKANHGKTGPGGCTNDKECRTFCSDPTNAEECTSFAVKEGRMTAEQAEQMKAFLTRGPGGRNPGRGPGNHSLVIDEEKARQVLQDAGEGPGACASFEECGAYCETAGHEEECFNFAREHELVKPEDLEKFKKLTTIVGPGGCQGRACRDYCEDVAHREECFSFAKINDLIPREELDRIEKMKEIGRKVEEHGGPGGCRGEGECRSYCSNTEHFNECAAFAVNEGFLSPEDAEGSLREFIEVEHDFEGGQGFSPRNFDFPSGGPEGFNRGDFPPQGFAPRGFGPMNGEEGFPPGFENIPDDAVRARVEEQFKSRFEEFEKFRGRFEKGEIPERSPEDFDEHILPPEERGRMPEDFSGNREDQRMLPPGQRGEMPQLFFREGDGQERRFEGQTPGAFMPPQNGEHREGFMPPPSGDVDRGSSFSPPPGDFPHPEGNFMPPAGSFDGGGSFAPPSPSGDFMAPSDGGSFVPPPPPPSPPPPSALLPDPGTIFANTLSAVKPPVR